MNSSGYAEITEVDINEQYTEPITLPDTIYGKTVYLPEDLLEAYPEIGHSHRSAGSVTSTENEHSYTCGICQRQVTEAHSGGTATCSLKAVCEAVGCGKEYGEFDRANHDRILKVEAKPATTTAPGNKEHYKCLSCGRFFADAACTVEITEESTIIPAAEKINKVNVSTLCGLTVIVHSRVYEF